MSLEKEVELVLYGELDSLEQIDAYKDRIVKQLQVQSKFGTDRLRVRLENHNGSIKRTLTLKSGKGSDTLEYEKEISSEVFTGLLGLLGDKGMRKDRLTIPFKLDDVTFNWEIDLFPLKEDMSQYCPWVKIDLEMPLTPSGGVIVPNVNLPLPLKFKRVISSLSKSKEDKELITQLYEKYFLL